jgi:hypothetical protein
MNVPIPCPYTFAKPLGPSCSAAPPPWAATSRRAQKGTSVASGTTRADTALARNAPSSKASAARLAAGPFIVVRPLPRHLHPASRSQCALVKQRRDHEPAAFSHETLFDPAPWRPAAAPQGRAARGRRAGGWGAAAARGGKGALELLIPPDFVVGGMHAEKHWGWFP